MYKVNIIVYAKYGNNNLFVMSDSEEEFVDYMHVLFTKRSANSCNLYTDVFVI